MMKKKLVILVCMLIVALVCTGCVYQTGNRITGGKDVQTFTYAYISLDGKKIAEGFVTQWRDYEDSDVVQVLIGGKYYLTHYSNVILVADPEHGTLQYSNPDNFTNE